MSDIKPKKGILDIVPYKGGNHNVKNINDYINLASNESSLGPSSIAIEAYKAAVNNLYQYPDGSNFNLRESISKRYSLNVDQIVCGAGSDDLIDNLIRSFAGASDEVLYSQYGFLMYPIICKSVGANPVFVKESNFRLDVESLLSGITKKTKVIIFANPNNPTGSYITDIELNYLCKEVPKNILIVIDAAYAEYVIEEDYTSGIKLVEKFDNLVMTRTFSKLYGLAALRIGWMYSSIKLANIINNIRLPFNVNLAAQAAGSEAILDLDHEKKVRDLNLDCLELLVKGLNSLDYEVLPSVANFVLVNFCNNQNAESAAMYLKNEKILVRTLKNYGLPEYIRISVGTKQQVSRLLDSLSNFKGI
ncbi:histidinol-phosphate transaminase [Alphaproteobacteria bacterium]|nr:histidinol-phosphate transaminase [Alphaproteobacteria bacterium]